MNTRQLPIPTLKWVGIAPGRYAARTFVSTVVIEYVPDFPKGQRWALYTEDQNGQIKGDWDGFPTLRDAKDFAHTLCVQGDIDKER